MTQQQQQEKYQHFNDFAYDLEDLLDSEVGPALDIISFVKHELDLGIELTREQALVLKCIYNLPLEEKDLEILNDWKEDDRTTWEPGETYQTLILEAGRRGGKTNLVSIICTYEFYRLCKLASPQQYYGLAKSTPITILAIARNYSQSKDVTFRYITGAVRSCRYLSKLEKDGEIMVGLEEVKHPGKMIYIKPGNSQSASNVGATLKALVLDEAARFENKDGKSNADEIWTNVGAALTSFRENALRVAISSAWEKGDAIETFYERSKKATTSVGFRLRSKDINPIHGGDDNPFVKDAFETDPEQAYLEYYGIRPMSQNAFLNEEAIDRAFRGKRKVVADSYEKSLPTGEKLLALSVSHITPLDHPTGTIVHLDPAAKGDFYGCALAHAEFDEDKNQIVHIDAVLSWQGDKKVNVSISDVYKVLMEIHKVRPIEYVSADQFNSYETLQKFKEAGIRADDLSFSKPEQFKMYSTLKQLLNEDRIVLPMKGWRSLLERELKQVQLINGKSIDHPDSGSKDLADCVAAVAYHLNQRTLKDKASSPMPLEASQVKVFNPSGKSSKLLSSIPERKQHFRERWKNRNNF